MVVGKSMCVTYATILDFGQLSGRSYGNGKNKYRLYGEE